MGRTKQERKRVCVEVGRRWGTYPGKAKEEGNRWSNGVVNSMKEDSG